MSKKDLFLTIDFEDWKFDLSYKFNILKNNTINEEELYKSYYSIEKFIDRKFQKKKITFFFTGILAKKFPKIIEEISKNGHEIGCHYFHHNNIFNDTVLNFKYNIQKAKGYLEDISGKRVSGFRAPKFTINYKDNNYYKIINEYFDYDSSLNTSNINDEFYLTLRNKYPKLNLLPVFMTSHLLNLIKFKPGGTFMKIMPFNFLKNNIEKSCINNFKPIIYMHPYEFLYEKEFAFSKEDLKNKNIQFATYWYLRQNQWHSFNKNLIKKLDKIFDIYKSGGTLNSQIM